MKRLTSLAFIAVFAAALAAACAQKTSSPSAAQPTATTSAPTAAAPAPTTPAPSPSATTPPATAQASPSSAAAAEAATGDILSEIALTRSAIQARRQAIVTAAMDLTGPEAEAFWPMYRDYRTDMAKVDDRLVNLILVYAANYDSLTDDKAKQLLSDYFDVERARLDVKTQYVPRFNGVLPARKVARFFQVDNKLDKKIQAELAEEIPLAR
jgi:hypothetical protein